jgi:hypothetical protein
MRPPCTAAISTGQRSVAPASALRAAQNVRQGSVEGENRPIRSFAAQHDARPHESQHIGQHIRTGRHQHGTAAAARLLQRRFKGRRVVGLPVARGAEVSDIRHDRRAGQRPLARAVAGVRTVGDVRLSVGAAQYACLSAPAVGAPCASLV